MLDDERHCMSTRGTNAVSTPWAIVLLFFAPSRLVAHSVDHAIRSQPGGLTSEREAELRASFTRQFQEALRLIRASLLRAFLVVAAAVAGAFLTSVVLKMQGVLKSENWNVGLQFAGIGVLLWATLGRVESPIQTLEGETFPERVDQWLYRLLYVVGSYALALSVIW